jgi:uncharacterized membrane protein
MGLQLRDPCETRTRGELLREQLTSKENGWQSKLEETYMTRRYFFDTRLQSTRDFSDLNFEGHATALGGALKGLNDRFAGQPLAGVLLFTDGNATDLENGFTKIPGLPPIYPVVVGKEGHLRDLSIDRVSASQTVFEDAPVTITAEARAVGFNGEKGRAEVVLHGKVVARQSFNVRNDKETVPLRFQLKPEEPGISFYEIKVGLENSFNTNRAEATLYNNSRVVPIDRGKGPHRILYVGGRPNWEYKFLNRAISEDPEVQLVALIRIARREPKFVFRGRLGESSNPLFKGFNKDEEETARYDQPVLIRLNTKDEVELREGFPKTPEALYGYEGVIIGDMEASFFSSDQMLLLQKFVADRGGGLLMLGGADSFQDGKYARTPIGEMLPVYLDRLPEPELAADFKLEITREGWLQPWTRLRANEQDERARLDQLPRFEVFNQLKEVKPGALVLATANDRKGKKFPGIVVQRFGSGRVGCILIGDLWRSGLGDEKRQADLQKSWRQIARWLISDTPSRFELRVEPEKAGDENSAVRLIVKARNGKFEPLENASVKLSVSGSAGPAKTNTIHLQADASDQEPGVYHAAYVPRETGAYQAKASISDPSGMVLGEADAGWASEPLAREFASLTPNLSLLRDIARQTGGEMISMDNLKKFVQTLRGKRAPIQETYSYPLWDQSWVFLLALACFTIEWGIRRWKGLA